MYLVFIFFIDFSLLFFHLVESLSPGFLLESHPTNKNKTEDVGFEPRLVQSLGLYG